MEAGITAKLNRGDQPGKTWSLPSGHGAGMLRDGLALAIPCQGWRTRHRERHAAPGRKESWIAAPDGCLRERRWPASSPRARLPQVESTWLPLVYWCAMGAPEGLRHAFSARRPG